MRNTYKGYSIKEVPTDKFPEMVELSKGDLKKKFVDMSRAKLWVEEQRTEDLIDKQKIKVQDELYETGVFFIED